MQLRTDPDAIAPERAIVFEVAGSIAAFYQEASRIGLEYLADDERDIKPDSDFHLTKNPDEPISGRIYLAMPNTAALDRLVRLWRRYKANRRMENGFAMWTQLFNMLKDVRAWGPRDRLLRETLTRWEENLREAPEEPVQFEVELWYRDDPAIREQAFERFRASVASLDGEIVNESVIPEIRYCAALIKLPAIRIRDLIVDPTVTLARVDEIIYIRPQSMAEFPVDYDPEDDPAPQDVPAPSELPPIAALLDGLPVQNHQRLANRLIVDDPEGLEPSYLVSARKHGTEMASLILHGDLNCGEPPLTRPLYVRPVLKPEQTLNGWEERTPTDRLLVDYVYRAVLRMKEGEAGEPATAPDVFIINISLGDPRRPFAGPMSPWARLLDYLAHRYRVLFLVSAGNVLDTLPLPGFVNWTAFEGAPADEREKALFEALNGQKANRTLFSPAEAMNVLTVGAAHKDNVVSGRRASMAIDAISNTDLPNISSALGLGHRRAIKPDLLAAGGREYVSFHSTNPHLHVKPVNNTGHVFGLLAAAPDPAGGDTTRTALTCGTSAATAITTRAGHLVYEALMDHSDGSMLADTPSEYYGLVVKALLVHSTAWGSSAAMIEALSGTDHYAKKDNVSRFLGHGVLDTARIVACTAERATLVGYGDIAPGTASLYRIPLPLGLEGIREQRSVTVTLAWFAPINPRHQGYRMVALEAKPGGNPKMFLNDGRAKMQPHDKAISRGTVFHDRREGKRAAPYVDGGDLLLRISARETAGEFKGRVPYAVAVSIEVGVGSAIPVYDQVRAAVMTRIQPPVTA